MRIPPAEIIRYICHHFVSDYRSYDVSEIYIVLTKKEKKKSNDTHIKVNMVRLDFHETDGNFTPGFRIIDWNGYFY